jgi:hypothetical protein
MAFDSSRPEQQRHKRRRHEEALHVATKHDIIMPSTIDGFGLVIGFIGLINHS